MSAKGLERLDGSLTQKDWQIMHQNVFWLMVTNNNNRQKSQNNINILFINVRSKIEIQIK